MGVPFTAGQRLTGADLNTATQQGAWTSYTPVWSSSGTQPVLNNGTLVGYYAKIGRLVVAKIMLNTGNTTTFGTGFYSWTLPLTAAVTGIPAGQFAHCGSIAASNGSSAFYAPTAIILQSTPTAVNGIVNGSGTFLGATNPATFAGSGCQFEITISYESVS